MLDWFSDLFTLEHLGYFMFGALSTCLWQVLKARWQKRIVIIRWQYIAFPMIIALAIYMAVENQQNADCTRQFNQAIRDSRRISTENDSLSIRHRSLLSEKGRAETFMWINALKPPDPEIAKLSFADPRRQEWGRKVVDDYASVARRIDLEILDIEGQQRFLIASRPPLPDPTCGR